MVRFVITLDDVLSFIFILLNNLNGIGGALRDSEDRPIQMTFSFYLVFLGEHGPIRS